MAYIQVEGGNPLKGSLRVQGAKNAVLPILSAALLHNGTTVLTEVPDISDVRDTLELLRVLGCLVEQKGRRVVIEAKGHMNGCLPQRMVGRMRSSFLLAGAMLGREGRLETFYPGGCTIGARPIDLHLAGLRKMGAEYVTDRDRISLWADRLAGTEISLAYPSVGATENLILAAVLADGVTVLRGAAREPEIQALLACLKGMGADIREEAGTIVIHGVSELQDSVYEIPGDRIVAGTILAAVGSCGGDVLLEHVEPEGLGCVLELLGQAGMELDVDRAGSRIRAKAAGPLPRGMELVTGPFPEFPTDLQAIFMAMLSVAGSGSRIRETVFESRFRHVEQLRRLGAKIEVSKDVARISGGSMLQGGLVEAQDLRAGAALVVAGLAAEGITLISHAEYIARGYENLPEVLQGLGVQVVQL
ncbi:MAG: UDP-N-acetylglucosamine 1-carboxyvinyltransferase [Lachnospiraceae bacterium]|nr:UDP-N-acetylglucosamine 1-carboxyvinyltransferase [Lachnospiraceae bacterium]